VLACVVLKPKVGEDLPCPGCPAVDRKHWGSITSGTQPREALDELSALFNVFAELARSLAPRRRVRIAVASELVPALGDLAHQVRVVLGRHSNEKERRSCTDLVEKREEPTDLPFEACVRNVPVGVAESTMDELVPVLKVESEHRCTAADHRATDLMLAPFVTSCNWSTAGDKLSRLRFIGRSRKFGASAPGLWGIYPRAYKTELGPLASRPRNW